VKNVDRIGIYDDGGGEERHDYKRRSIYDGRRDLCMKADLDGIYMEAGRGCRKGEIHITRGRIHITTDREYMIVKTSIEPILVCLICGWFN
jgi:hypothetical protein